MTLFSCCCFSGSAAFVIHLNGEIDGEGKKLSHPWMDPWTEWSGGPESWPKTNTEQSVRHTKISKYVFQTCVFSCFSNRNRKMQEKPCDFCSHRLCCSPRDHHDQSWNNWCQKNLQTFLQVNFLNQICCFTDTWNNRPPATQQPFTHYTSITTNNTTTKN